MRQTNKLSPLAVNRLKDPGVYCDGLGLWLSVSKWGTKAWIFRYTRHGRRRHMSLGALHTVSLAEARERARRARQILLDGDDPLEIARKKRDEARAKTAERILFKDAAERFLDLHQSTWKNGKHREQWGSTLRLTLIRHWEAALSPQSTGRSLLKPSHQFGSRSPRPRGG